MNVPSSERNGPPRPRPADDRLDSWKDIAAYLKRDVSTVQRWERNEGLPVHRHFHRKLGSVYAYRFEIDEWSQRRASRAGGGHAQTVGDVPSGWEIPPSGARWKPGWRMPVAVAGLAAALVTAVVYWGREGTRDTPGAEVDPMAYREYTAGRFYLSKQNEADITRAIDHFEQATRIAPHYAAASAALSDAWWARGIWGARTLSQVETESRAAVQKALASSPESAETRVSVGRIRYTYDRDWPGAEAEFHRALVIDPDSRDAHYFYAMLLMGLGRFPESISHIERAAELDPLSSMVQSGFGRVLYRARRYDEAIDRLQRAIALEPRNAGAFARLGDVYVAMGRYADALSAYDGALRAGSSGLADRERRAHVYARMGRAAEARRLVGDRGGPGAAVGAAKVYAALGDLDRAFQLLFSAADDRSQNPLLLFFNQDPAFDGLRADVRWNTLLARLNLDAGRYAGPSPGTR